MFADYLNCTMVSHIFESNKGDYRLFWIAPIFTAHVATKRNGCKCGILHERNGQASPQTAKASCLRSNVILFICINKLCVVNYFRLCV